MVCLLIDSDCTKKVLVVTLAKPVLVVTLHTGDGNNCTCIMLVMETKVAENIHTLVMETKTVLIVTLQRTCIMLVMENSFGCREQ